MYPAPGIASPPLPSYPEDRFGLSWQIVPDRLYELVSDPDPARATAATKAMYGMRKIVIADLEEAAEQVAAR